MKALIFLSFVITSFSFTLTPGDENVSVASRSGAESIKMRVIVHRTDCRMYGGLSQCCVAQIGSEIGGNEWTMLKNPIQGFTPVEGFTYDLRVEADFTAGERQADAPATYKLVSVVSKRPS